jgi:hypothetical protein
MNRYILIGLVFTFILSCKGKTTAENGEQLIDVSDFIEYFPPGKLPYEVNDTIFTAKLKDTSTIRYNEFSQFVSDSIRTTYFGKANPRINPLLRAFSGDEGTYLFARAITPEKKMVLLLTFNVNNEFTGSMPLLVQDASPTTRQVSGVDRRLSIYKNVIRRESDGTLMEGKEVYVHDPASSSFMLIMTDALDERSGDIINPIDTFQKKNKFSADYLRDKTNVVSIRDAGNGRFRFFVHIDRNKGDCIGELKGEGKFTSANVGVYQQAGDPCSLQFNFTTSSVRITEIEACGNRRGVKCSFDGTYPRKKEAKKPPLKK